MFWRRMHVTFRWLQKPLKVVRVTEVEYASSLGGTKPKRLDDIWSRRPYGEVICVDVQSAIYLIHGSGNLRIDSRSFGTLFMLH